MLETSVDYHEYHVTDQLNITVSPKGNESGAVVTTLADHYDNHRCHDVMNLKVYVPTWGVFLEARRLLRNYEIVV